MAEHLTHTHYWAPSSASNMEEKKSTTQRNAPLKNCWLQGRIAEKRTPWELTALWNSSWTWAHKWERGPFWAQSYGRGHYVRKLKDGAARQKGTHTPSTHKGCGQGLHLGGFLAIVRKKLNRRLEQLWKVFLHAHLNHSQLCLSWVTSRLEGSSASLQDTCLQLT